MQIAEGVSRPPISNFRSSYGAAFVSSIRSSIVSAKGTGINSAVINSCCVDL
jgi:hypothetical protein